jgi:hypothetical protein
MNLKSIYSWVNANKYNILVVIIIIIAIIIVIWLFIKYLSDPTEKSIQNSDILPNPNSDNSLNKIEIELFGRSGNEIFEIKSLEGDILMSDTIAPKEPIKIVLNTNLESFIINFKNDNSQNDIRLTKIIKNGNELSIDKHIRGDLRFPPENPRYNSVLEGRFSWSGEYRIDL